MYSYIYLIIYFFHILTKYYSFHFFHSNMELTRTIVHWKPSLMQLMNRLVLSVDIILLSLIKPENSEHLHSLRFINRNRLKRTVSSRLKIVTWNFTYNMLELSPIECYLARRCVLSVGSINFGTHKHSFSPLAEQSYTMRMLPSSPFGTWKNLVRAFTNSRR